MVKNTLKRLPLGISDFKKIIDGNYIYVDKTHIIHQMIHTGDYYFLSRPRRFGKSLLVSTLDAIFSGKKELFNDLWIVQSDYSWQKYPIISIDFSTIDASTIARLTTSLLKRLNFIAALYNITLALSESVNDSFSELISKLSQKNKVVILIDEYDKPILDYIDQPEEAGMRREVLKNLYSVIKGSDQYLRFVLLTGVSKFAKTSIFSGINNLTDISMNTTYALMLGYTKSELTHYFYNYINQLAEKQGSQFDETIQKLTDDYDGYLFAEHTEHLFNPYSILSCFNENKYKNYWFATGTPTFLIKRIKTGDYPINSLYQPIMAESELDSFEPENIKITALLYQTGYLTITRYNHGTNEYTLDFPNKEVSHSLNLLIASSCTQLSYRTTRTYAARIAQAFAHHNMDDLIFELQSLFNEMPYTVHVEREFDLHIIIFSIFKLIGLEVDPEVTTSLGRADLVVTLPKLIYIIELKFNKSAHEALTQIQDRRYYEKYENMGKKITLLGINFEATNKIVSLEVQAL